MNRPVGVRSSIVDASSGTELQIRAPRLWGPLIFLPVWFVGWTFGGIMAMRAIVANPQLFLGVWLLGWLFGEVFVVVAWSWLAFGKEVVSVAQGTLTIARRVGPWQIARNYLVRECSAMRASGWFGSPNLFADGLRPWGLTGGTVSFDYRNQAVRFGIGLDEAEAEAVVKELEPSLA